MTSTLIEDDQTVHTFLFGGREAAGTGLGEAMAGRHVARSALRASRRLGAAVLGAVDREVGEAAGGMLDIGLGEALVHGWARHAQLVAAGRRTLAGGGSEVVALATHRVTSTYRPAVDLLVDGVARGSVELEVRLVFDVTGLAAVVRGGDLVAVRGGDVLLTATVLLYGEQLAARTHRLDPQLVVRLDPPLALAVARSELPVLAPRPAGDTDPPTAPESGRRDGLVSVEGGASWTASSSRR